MAPKFLRRIETQVAEPSRQAVNIAVLAFALALLALLGVIVALGATHGS